MTDRKWLSGDPRRLAIAVVMVSMLLVTLGTAYTERDVHRDASARTEREADAAVTAIRQRLLAHTEVLVALRGFFEQEPSPTRARFRDFVRSLQVEARYPGVEALSFAEVVEPFHRGAYQRRARRDAAASGSAYPPLEIAPSRERQVVVGYLEPVAGNEAAYGLDLLSEPHRRAALLATQRTGQPVATEPIELVQQRGHGKEAFLFMLAVRDVSGTLTSTRTGRLRGVVSAAFDTGEMLENITPGAPSESEVEVYDVGVAGSRGGRPRGASLTEDRDGRADATGEIDSDTAALRPLDIGGRRWAIYYERRGSAAGIPGANLPFVVAGAGAALSLLAGLLIFALARNRDIGHRQRNREQFRELLESAPDAIVIVDERGRIVFVNTQTEKLFGYRQDDLIGDPIEVLVPERFRGAHGAHRDGFFHSPATRPMGAGLELSALHAQGHEIPVEISLSPLSTDDGTLVSAAIRDITDRRVSEHALREAEELFRRAFEDAGIGMALVGVGPEDGGRLLQVNDGLCEVTGYGREQLLRMRLPALTHPEDVAGTVEGLRELLAGDIDTLQLEHRILDAHGDTVWVSLTSSLVHDDDGEPVYRIVQLQDVSERKRFEGQLQHLADHDPLTGLFNRRRFEDELARELSSARRYGNGGAVLALDLDNFKYVNDTLGHAAGDELLTTVASLLRGRLRDTDILARLGGDEFALILPRADEGTARVVAESLLDAVRERAVVTTDKGTRRTTASIGVAPFGRGSDAATSEEILVEADIAMYDAKEAGRDQLSVYDANSSRHARMEARMTWVEQIRRALAEDRFTLHAQPIVPLQGDAIPRFELLLRMIGEHDELIPPGTFLYVAERADLVQEIDRWVISHAIELLAASQRAGRDVCFEVNLSAKSITDGELVTFIGRELAASGADPSRLVFEVTETAAIINVDRARLFAHSLHELGCGFALDDFGAGFASFYYLKHLAFDYLKIDGEFIEDLASNRTNQLVVHSLVEIARGLGKQTIAEFVTDAETLEMLRGYGVDFAQGNYVGEPRAIEAPGRVQAASRRERC